jgi:phosphatidylcholine synthase
MHESDRLGSRLSLCLSWGVHLLTASGAVLGVFALLCLAEGRLAPAALLMLASLVIDGVDGTLARAVGVTKHIPWFDGRRLDDLVDFLNFVIVPVVFFEASGRILGPAWLVAPILASAYGFSRIDAKTEDDFFLGFPSYWNILAIYLWLLDLSALASTLWIVGLSIAVFVPLKYLYPTKVQPALLRHSLGVGALVWIGVLVGCIEWPERMGDLPWLELSLAYPAWYLWLSLRRGGLVRHPGRLD